MMCSVLPGLWTLSTVQYFKANTVLRKPNPFPSSGESLKEASTEVRQVRVIEIKKIIQQTLEIKTQLYIYIYISQTMVTANNSNIVCYIQGVPRGRDKTSEECSLC